MREPIFDPEIGSPMRPPANWQALGLAKQVKMLFPDGWQWVELLGINTPMASNKSQTAIVSWRGSVMEVDNLNAFRIPGSPKEDRGMRRLAE